jgi:hypothetical protein
MDQQIQVTLPPSFTLQISPEVLDYILTSLSDRPYKEARQVIQGIEEQRNKQIEAVNPELVQLRASQFRKQADELAPSGKS